MITWRVVKVCVKKEGRVEEYEENSRDKFPEEVFYEVSEKMGINDSLEVAFVKQTGTKQVAYGLKGRNSGIEVEVLVEFQ